MSDSILILTNTKALGSALMLAAKAAVKDKRAIFAMTYQESIALLTPQRIRETGFFILDLFRDYPGGSRAEGVVLARRWMPRTPCLIVSPLYLSRQIDCPGYWDVEANDTLPERISHILINPYLPAQGLEKVEKCFSNYLKLPPQH